jgi:hypothetical protein
MVTVTTKNGEVGKCIGIYADEFVLRPGKRYSQQLLCSGHGNKKSTTCTLGFTQSFLN